MFVFNERDEMRKHWK